jgi:hypothetical protein
MGTLTIEKITIVDDLSLQRTAGIEVIVELNDKSRRWCYFMTPDALKECGDRIEGTEIIYHFGSPHMIVVSSVLTEEIIHVALRAIETAGGLLKSTIKIGIDNQAKQGSGGNVDKPRV